MSKKDESAERPSHYHHSFLAKLKDDIYFSFGSLQHFYSSPFAIRVVPIITEPNSKKVAAKNKRNFSRFIVILMIIRI